MPKKILSINLVLIIALSVFTATATAATTPPATTKPAASGLTATPTNSKVLINGKDTSFDAYLIEGNNYFKLRDLAFVLSGTEKQFEVGWDGENNAISLTSGMAYTVVGGEMTGRGDTPTVLAKGSKSASPTSSKIFLDDIEVKFTAFNIEDNNYFKLRDVGEAFDFGVDWDGAKNTIVIDTGKGYSLDGTTSAKPPKSTPEPMPKPDDTKPDDTVKPPSGGDNAVSINALVGNWGRVDSLGKRDLPYWVFSADGRFAVYTAQYNPNSGAGYSSYYERWVQGKYRVNGYTIEFSDCRVSSYEKVGGGWQYFDESMYELPANTLLDTALPDPKNSGDFSAMFDFDGAMRLRLVTKNDVIDYDSDFNYHGSSRNITVPTHSIPPAPWPKGDLPVDVLEYSNGRIRQVYTYNNELHIIINRTTREDFANYVRLLRQSGWSGSDSVWYTFDEALDLFGKGEFESYQEFIKKGNLNLMVSMGINGRVEIAFF